jgi:NTE family protein
MTDTRTATLVLGSGGARGLAHIGVIRELEQRGYQISAIAGTSMGALIGGVHAMGKLQAYADWVTTLDRKDILKLLDWQFSSGGLIKGKHVMDKLRELLGDCNIEDLRMPYMAVAVDLDQGKEVWLDSGNLFDAIRASIAIPGVFTPHVHQDCRLVDGGLLNPVPVVPALRYMSDLVIAVDANGARNNVQARETKPQPDESKPENLIARMGNMLSANFDGKGFEISRNLLDALDIMQAQLTRLNLSMHQPDILIEIPHRLCHIHEFDRAREIIDAGQQLARNTLDQLDDNP